MTEGETRPPLPPFTEQTAIQKVRMAEDAWNSRDPARVALAYTADSKWRNRVEFIEGRAEMVRSIRALADFIEQRTDLPVPHSVEAQYSVLTRSLLPCGWAP